MYAFLPTTWWETIRCKPAEARGNENRQAPALPGIGITGIPFTRNCVLDVMTRSPALNPDVTAYELPTVSPSVMETWEAM